MIIVIYNEKWKFLCSLNSDRCPPSHDVATFECPSSEHVLKYITYHSNISILLRSINELGMSTLELSDKDWAQGSTLGVQLVSGMYLSTWSLFIVTFISLTSQVIPIMQTTKEVNPHPHVTLHANIWSVFFFFFFLSHLNCWCMDLPHCPRRPSGRLTCADGSCDIIP